MVVVLVVALSEAYGQQPVLLKFLHFPPLLAFARLQPPLLLTVPAVARLPAAVAVQAPFVPPAAVPAVQQLAAVVLFVDLAAVLSRLVGQCRQLHPSEYC